VCPGKERTVTLESAVYSASCIPGALASGDNRLLVVPIWGGAERADSVTRLLRQAQDTGNDGGSAL